MSKIKFKRTVLRSTSHLAQRGYQVAEPGPGPEVVQFWKNPVTGIRCGVEFELIPQFIPPVRQFNVVLFRRRLPDFPEEELHYSPLAIDLPNLTRGFYRLSVLPLGKYWEFTDEQSLSQQLAHAQSLLMDYGIPWLEDPTSNVEWVKHRKDES